MAKKSLTTQSGDQVVKQTINWDTVAKTIDVTQEVSVPALKNVIFNKKVSYAPGSLGFDAICQKYNLVIKPTCPIMEYLYDIVDDNHYPNPHTVIFSATLDYHLTGLSKVVACEAAGPYTTSRTSGEAVDE